MSEGHTRVWCSDDGSERREERISRRRKKTRLAGLDWMGIRMMEDFRRSERVSVWNIPLAHFSYSHSNITFTSNVHHHIQHHVSFVPACPLFLQDRIKNNILKRKWSSLKKYLQDALFYQVAWISKKDDHWSGKKRERNECLLCMLLSCRRLQSADDHLKHLLLPPAG